MSEKNFSSNENYSNYEHTSKDLLNSYSRSIYRLKFSREIFLMGVVYIFLQAFILLLPIDPFIDYENHISWGIAFEKGLYPYRDFTRNEYPVLSVWGWIVAYTLCPIKSYYWLSVAMNLPYWILAAIGGMCFYRLLNDYGVEDRSAFILSCFFLFFPANLVDTLNNHGSVGTAATVIIAIYLWHQEKYKLSAAFVAAGFSIKLYPLFVAPFLIWSLQNNQQKLKYLIWLGCWITIFHLPVILILPEYFEALAWRTTTWGGVSYGVLIGEIGELVGINQIVTLVWLSGLALSTIFLLMEDNLTLFEKFALIMMVNNLLEFQGGIGHIVVVLPYMAIYFLTETSDPRERRIFFFYLIFGCFWAFDRLIFDIRHMSEFTGVTSMGFMILFTTILFFTYLRGLTNSGQLQWLLPLEIWKHCKRFF